MAAGTASKSPSGGVSFGQSAAGRCPSAGPEVKEAAGKCAWLDWRLELGVAEVTG